MFHGNTQTEKLRNGSYLSLRSVSPSCASKEGHSDKIGVRNVYKILGGKPEERISYCCVVFGHSFATAKFWTTF
jgi:hypothetical protein